MSWGIRGKLRDVVKAYRVKSRYNVTIANEYDNTGPEGRELATKFRRIAHFLDAMADAIERILDREAEAGPRIYVGVEYNKDSGGFIVYSDEAGILMHGETLVQAFDAFCDALETQIENAVESPKGSVPPGKAMAMRRRLGSFPKERIFDEPTKKFYTGSSFSKSYIPGKPRKCPHCRGELED